MGDGGQYLGSTWPGQLEIPGEIFIVQAVSRNLAAYNDRQAPRCHGPSVGVYTSSLQLGASVFRALGAWESYVRGFAGTGPPSWKQMAHWYN